MIYFLQGVQMKRLRPQVQIAKSIILKISIKFFSRFSFFNAVVPYLCPILSKTRCIKLYVQVIVTTLLIAGKKCVKDKLSIYVERKHITKFLKQQFYFLFSIGTPCIICQNNYTYYINTIIIDLQKYSKNLQIYNQLRFNPIKANLILHD